MLIVLNDDVPFVAKKRNNLRITFTQSNPTNDIYGVSSFTKSKHEVCKGALV